MCDYLGQFYDGIFVHDADYYDGDNDNDGDYYYYYIELIYKMLVDYYERHRGVGDEQR